MFLRSDIDTQLISITNEFSAAAYDHRSKLYQEIAAGTTDIVNDNKNRKIAVLNRMMEIAKEIKKLIKPFDPRTLQPLKIENRQLTHAQYVEFNKLGGLAQRLNDCLVEAQEIQPVGPLSTLVAKQSATTALISDYIDKMAAVLPALKVDGVEHDADRRNELLKQVKNSLDKFLVDADEQLVTLKQEKDAAEKMSNKNSVVSNKSSKIDLLTTAVDAARTLQTKTIEAITDYANVSFQTDFVEPFRIVLDCDHKLKEVPSVGLLSFMQSSKSSSIVNTLVDNIGKTLFEIDPRIYAENEEKGPQL